MLCPFDLEKIQSFKFGDSFLKSINILLYALRVPPGGNQVDGLPPAFSILGDKINSTIGKSLLFESVVHLG